MSTTVLEPSAPRAELLVISRFAAVAAIADDAHAIAFAITEGAGFRLRFRSVASLMASSFETFSHVEDAASEWHGSGEACLCMGSGINAHEVVDVLLGASL